MWMQFHNVYWTQQIDFLGNPGANCNSPWQCCVSEPTHLQHILKNRQGESWKSPTPFDPRPIKQSHPFIDKVQHRDPVHLSTPCFVPHWRPSNHHQQLDAPRCHFLKTKRPNRPPTGHNTVFTGRIARTIAPSKAGKTLKLWSPSQQLQKNWKHNNTSDSLKNCKVPQISLEAPLQITMQLRTTVYAYKITIVQDNRPGTNPKSVAV